MAIHMRLTLVILAVRDLARAVQFYHVAFGWPQTVDVPVYAEFALPDDQRLGLYERHAFSRNTGQVPAEILAGDLTGTELYFYVDNISEVVARLAIVGARQLSALAGRD